jgi:hypothetical protein
MTLLAFTTLTLLPPQAYAGHYTVSYSGGNCNGQPYTFNNGVYGGGASANNQNPTVTCSGQITATFTWVPDPSIPNEPPPPAAVVMQNCTAQWQCNAPNAKSAQGSADNGLGFTPITVGNGTTQVGQSSSGVMYLIKTPAAGSDLSNFTVTCTPSASITIPVPFMGQAGAGITYSATATPLMVVLGGSGINLNTQPEYLIGQQVNCSLTYPSDLTASNYQWNPPAACQPFKAWLVTDFFGTPTPNVHQPQTIQLRLLADADLTQSSLSFYTKVPSNTPVTVPCTLNLIVPQGTHWDDGTRTKLVTLTSLQMQVLPPNYGSPLSSQASNNSYPVLTLTPIPYPITPSPYTHYTAFVGENDQGVMGAAMQYAFSVSTPTAFFLNGDIGDIQLFAFLTPSIEAYIGSTPYAMDNSMGIDQAWWLPLLQLDPAPAQPDGRQYIAKEISEVQPNTQGLSRIWASLHFHVWLMYKAPGNASYVPLADANWSWQGDEIWTENATWQFNPQANIGVSVGQGPISTFTYPAFPQWRNPYFNQKFLWPSYLFLIDHTTIPALP